MSLSAYSALVFLGASPRAELDLKVKWLRNLFNNRKTQSLLTRKRVDSAAMMMTRRSISPLRQVSFGRTALLAVFCAITLATFPCSAEAQKTAPRDWRHLIVDTDFQTNSSGEWVSPLVKTPFAFDELIYSWYLQNPGDTFRLFLQASFGAEDNSEWLYAGFWGDVTNVVTGRRSPTFDRGTVDMDWLKLKAKAGGFRFKAVAAGKNALTRPPGINVVITDNNSSPVTPSEQRVAEKVTGRVLDVPLRRQTNTQGEWMKDRCQSAALASAMQYFGKPVALEEIVRFTNDPEYNYPGLWPRVIGAAREFGFEGYVDRFRDWDKVRQALAQNKVILCSMRLKEGEAKSPPYKSMGNHIVALCGVTDDGRVVVTDSALGKSGRGYLCQWLLSDFEHVWMKTKGGVAMVICPPTEFEEKLVKDLPPFPKDRTLPAGDDH